MRIVPFAALALLAAAPARAQDPAAERPDHHPTRVSGTVLGADGAPMRLANVSVYGMEPGATEVVEVAEDGRYELEIDSIGVFTLAFTGVDHLQQNTPLLILEPGGEIVLDARLSTYEYRDDFSSVSLIGDFNEFSFQQDVRRMEAQDDGTYVLEVEVEEGADSLAYQLLNAITEPRSINGTMSDWFVYDGGGDYRSVVAVEETPIRIRFDPAQAHRVEAEPEVRFGDPSSVEAEYAAFARRLDDYRQEYVDSMSALRERDVPREEMRAFSQEYDWSAVRAYADSAIDAAGDGELRTILLATYLSRATTAADSLTARSALAEIEPGSWKWTIGYDLLTRTVYRSGQVSAYTDYLYAALRENASEALRASAVNLLLMQAHRDEEANPELKKALFTWLVAEYPESFEARYALAELDPARAIREGRPVPAFALADLEDSTVIHSNESLLGTVYLMDFWAVWCGPCIGEMPELHAAFEKYKDDGFTILSLSFDGSPEDVVEYREGEFPMPWLHVFVEGGFGSELAETFNILGIPKPILVGADGVILTTSGLRGERLDETLAEVFGRETVETTP